MDEVLDDAERCTQIVGDQTHHLVAHPVELAQLRRRLAFAAEHTTEGVLVALALGQVAGDLGEAALLAVGSRSAVITTFAQKREPSLRTRQPSFSNRPSASAVRSAVVGHTVARRPPACRTARSAGR